MNNEMVLRYHKPAAQWEETIPIGNGSLGAMIFGNVKEEKLGLNEESIWSGYHKDKNNSKAYEYLEKAREFIFSGRYKKAEELIQETMLGEYGESYLPLGNLHMKYSHNEEVQNYVRELDIDHSIASVSYTVDNVQYKREYISSYHHQAIFIHVTTSKPVLGVNIFFNSELRYHGTSTDNGIHLSLQCPEHIDPDYIKSDNPTVWGDKGFTFTSDISILSCNGKVLIDNETMTVEEASELLLMISAVKAPNFFEGRSFEEIKRIHCLDYKAIYNKVELYLGDQKSLPTNERLQELKEGKEDPALYALYFQYGRYLLISSSRKGSLAANLQGIWSWDFRPPWSSNWTTNINLQMNYWPAQCCNLVECISPYFELLKNLCREGKKTATINYHCRGFVHHHNADRWYNTNPVGLIYGEEKGNDGSVTWSFWPMGGAWMASELYKHYEYNEDITFLRETAYPILKEAALFLIDWLVDHEGEYVTCPSTSPENRFLTKDGEESCVAVSSTLDITLIREVFDYFKRTCKELEIEDEILPVMEERLSKLTPISIGSIGQLLEWRDEFVEKEIGHRHISHLYGLFPSELFGTDKSLIEACKISLERRLSHGGGHTGWSCAWIINMFAIMGDSINAYKYLNTLLTRSTYDNLWDSHPPFQIDGNFGGTAGIANMLVQDRNGEVQILPALPKEFPNGFVKGLRIKHKKAIDITWKDGQMVKYNIYHLDK